MPLGGGGGPGVGARLRTLIRRALLEYDVHLQWHPEVQAALQQLLSAVEQAFPSGEAASSTAAPSPSVGSKRASLGSKRASLSAKITRLRNQLSYLRKQHRLLQARLKSFQVGKVGRANRISPEFLAKVSLSWPTTCARGFADAWRDLVGVGVAGLSRPTITKIRDGFAQVVKDMRLREIGLVISSAAKAPDSAASAPAAAHPAPGGMCAAILHIHDEASLRLRDSQEAQGGAPSRGRRSMVQQHIMYLHALGQQPVRWPAELDPLSSKNAQVLATSLHAAFRELAEPTCAALVKAQSAEPPWLFHWLVGDGVNTNYAAAKILLAWVRRKPLSHGVRYFLLTIKCANHQANLAIGSAVQGKAAVVGYSNSAATGANPLASRVLRLRSKSAASNICGAIVRLFKYLVSDYYADMCANLQDLVQAVVPKPATAEDLSIQRHWLGMQRLYGEDVLPTGILQCLNTEPGSWTHCVVSAASTPGLAARSTIFGVSARSGFSARGGSGGARYGAADSACSAFRVPTQGHLGCRRAAHPFSDVHLPATRGAPALIVVPRADASVAASARAHAGGTHPPQG